MSASRQAVRGAPSVARAPLWLALIPWTVMGACSVERAGLGNEGDGGGAPDSGGALDGAPSIDAGALVDAATMDVPRFDAGAPDAGVHDAGATHDGGPGSDAGSDAPIDAGRCVGEGMCVTRPEIDGFVACVGGAPRPIVDCPFGCTEDGCNVLAPSNVREDAHLDDHGDLDITVTGLGWTLDTDDGEIRRYDIVPGTGLVSTVVRSAGEGIVAGIGYYRLFRSGLDLGVFVVRSFHVPTDTTVLGRGSRGLVLLVEEDALIEGRVSESPGLLRAVEGSRDALAAGGGAGGNHGNEFDQSGQDGEGAGHGHGGRGRLDLFDEAADSGGGGGGFGGAGGEGGAGGDIEGGDKGEDEPRERSLDPLAAGSGGGGGSDVLGGEGGRGGGAVQISAGGRVRITSTGRIEAGGEGGQGGRGGPSADDSGAGGGGGSGGAILLEAAYLDLLGTVCVLGGGGGAGSPLTATDVGVDGADGCSDVPPHMTGALAGPGIGGSGGNGSGPTFGDEPDDGEDGSSNGGGGGGGHGRVRLNASTFMRINVSGTFYPEIATEAVDRDVAESRRAP